MLRRDCLCVALLGGLLAPSITRAQEPIPQPPSDIKVVGSFRATDPDGTMRVRCTVTEDRHVKDCVNLSLDPAIAGVLNGGRSKDLDARVERWTPVSTRHPGTQEFKIRLQAPDAGTH